MQRDRHDLLSEFPNEGKRDATAIVVNAICAAKQTLVGHGFDSLLVYHSRVPQGNAKPLIQNAVKFLNNLGETWWSRGELNP